MDTVQTPGRGQEDPSSRRDRLRRLQTLLQRDPGNARLLRECRDAALLCGEYDFVLQQTQQILAVSPEDLPARFDRATAFIGRRDFEQAARLLTGITAQHPDLVAAQINLGLCHYSLSQYVSARAPLEQAYRLGERSPGLLRLLVSTYHHLGLMEEGLAIAQANPNPPPDAGLAGVYALLFLDASKPGQAAEWARKALTANPDSVDGLTVQATLEAAQMQVEAARVTYERVRALAPENGRAWVGLGTLALLARDLPQAMPLLTRGVELMPTHAGSRHVLAWTHLLAGDLDRAERLLQESLALDRNFAETHGGLASIAALRGRTQEAQRGIEIALRLDPKCLSAQFARSVLMGQAGNPAAGQQLLRQTLASLSPRDGSLLSRVIENAARQT